MDPINFLIDLALKFINMIIYSATAWPSLTNTFILDRYKTLFMKRRENKNSKKFSIRCCCFHVRVLYYIYMYGCGLLVKVIEKSHISRKWLVTQK